MLGLRRLVICVVILAISACGTADGPTVDGLIIDQTISDQSAPDHTVDQTTHDLVIVDAGPADSAMPDQAVSDTTVDQTVDQAVSDTTVDQTVDQAVTDTTVDQTVDQAVTDTTVDQTVDQGLPDQGVDQPWITPTPTSISGSFHKFSSSSSAEMTAWNNGFVVHDVSSVETYADDPYLVWPAGYVSTHSHSIFTVNVPPSLFTTIEFFSAPGTWVRASSVDTGGNDLFVLARIGWSNYGIYRFSGATQTMLNLDPSFKAYTIVADDTYIYTQEPTATSNTYGVVRRDHDGQNALPLGTFTWNGNFYGRTDTWAAGDGNVYTIPHGSGGTIRGYSAAGNYIVTGPSDPAATLAAAGNYLFIASGGIWRAPLGSATAQQLKTSAELKTDAGSSGGLYCGTRSEYGRGAGFSADANGVYILCRRYSPDENYVLQYTHDLVHVKTTLLPSSWGTLGRLRASSSHLCMLQQWNYSSSSKRSIVRCIAK